MSNHSNDNFQNRFSKREELKNIIYNNMVNNSNHTILVSGKKFNGKTRLIEKVLWDESNLTKKYEYTVWTLSSESHYNEIAADNKYINKLFELIDNNHNKENVFKRKIIIFFRKFLLPVLRGIIKTKLADIIDITDLDGLSNNDLKKIKKISKYLEKNNLIIIISDASRIDNKSLNIMNSLSKRNPRSLILIFEYSIGDDENDYLNFLKICKNHYGELLSEVKIEPLESKFCINIINDIILNKHLKVNDEHMDNIISIYKKSEGNLMMLTDLLNYSDDYINTLLNCDERLREICLQSISDNEKLIIYIMYFNDDKLKEFQLENIIQSNPVLEQVFITADILEQTLDSALNNELITINSFDELELKPLIVNELSNSIETDIDKVIKLSVYQCLMKSFLDEINDPYIKSSNIEQYNILMKLIRLCKLFDNKGLNSIFLNIKNTYSKLKSFDQRVLMITRMSEFDFKSYRSLNEIANFIIQESFSLGKTKITLQILDQIFDYDSFSHLIFKYMSLISQGEYSHYLNNYELSYKKYKHDSRKTFILHVVHYIYMIEDDHEGISVLYNKIMDYDQVDPLFYNFFLRSSSVVEVSRASIDKLLSCLDYFDSVERTVDIGISKMILFGQYLLSGQIDEARKYFFESINHTQENSYNLGICLNNSAVLDLVERNLSNQLGKHLILAKDLYEDNYTKMLIDNNLFIYYILMDDYHKAHNQKYILLKYIDSLKLTNYMKVCLYFNILKYEELFDKNISWVKNKINDIYEQEVSKLTNIHCLDLCNYVLNGSALSDNHPDNFLISKGFIYTDLGDWSFVLKFEDLIF